MNARRIGRLLAEADAATPQYRGTYGLLEAWSAGPVLMVVPALSDGYPPRLKTAVDRRRRATLTGRCDCGARRILDPAGLRFDHEPGCDAGDNVLVRLLEEHLAATSGRQP